MGVGALTDFGPMLRNLRLSIFGAAAQLGIFTVLLVAILMGFTPKEAASLGIIGGADGPTAIFTTIKLAPHLLGPIAIAAYSYMALVPVIIPLVVKIWCTKKELSINMKEQEKKYPSSVEIKNLRVLKIVFPIVVTTVVALFVPSAVHDTHIGRSSRFIHCLISDRGYFHYLVYRCSFQLKQTIFTTDGSTYKCRIRQRQQHHIGIWQRMVTFIYKFPLHGLCRHSHRQQHAHDKHDQIHFHLFH